MSARTDILAAIRRAAVPLSPPASPLAVAPDDAQLLTRFLGALESVGGRGAMRAPDQSTRELVADLLGRLPEQVMILPGRFAVAENGAVYVDAQDIGDRRAVVESECLVVEVPRDAIVATMHEAVRSIPRGSQCGWFLSGPSKTADIEQALVIGAQGARTMCVILCDH